MNVRGTEGKEERGCQSKRKQVSRKDKRKPFSISLRETKNLICFFNLNQALRDRSALTLKGSVDWNVLPLT